MTARDNSFHDANVESLRLPPHSLEAEQAVLGGLLLDNAAWDRIGDVIGGDDFYRQDHRVIWSSITRLIEENKPANVLTVSDALKSAGLLQDAGGLSYLHQLAAGTPGAANIRHYGAMVRERAIVRQLAVVGTAIADEAYNTRGRKAEDLLGEAESRILQIGAHVRRSENFQTMSTTLASVMETLDERHRNPATVTGIATGFVDLDEQTSGLQPGDLIVIAGRPSMGKTALALNIAEHVALELKLPVPIFSMEMSADQLGQRLLSSRAKIDSHLMRQGKVETAQWDRLGVALGELNEAPILIDDTGGLNVLEVRARARRMWRKHGGLGLVVVDYLQLMQASDGRDDNRATELAKITSALKAMAKELRCPVVLLSQLNRGLESRVERRPRMSDLRESGAIEQDADAIFFIYRDEVYNEESPDKGIAEIIIGKQRTGPIGTVRLTFLPKFTRFDNYAGQRDLSGSWHPTTPKKRRGMGAKDD